MPRRDRDGLDTLRVGVVQHRHRRLDRSRARREGERLRRHRVVRALRRRASGEVQRDRLVFGERDAVGDLHRQRRGLPFRDGLRIERQLERRRVVVLDAHLCRTRIGSRRVALAAGDCRRHRARRLHHGIVLCRHHQRRAALPGAERHRSRRIRGQHSRALRHAHRHRQRLRRPPRARQRVRCRRTFHHRIRPGRDRDNRLSQRVGRCGHRHQRAARRFPALHHRCHLIGIGGTRRHAAVDEGQVAGALGDRLDTRAFTRDGVGDGWACAPMGRVHPSPGQGHLPLAARRRQGRAFSKLVAELLPGRVPVPIEIHSQHGVFVGQPEVPEVVLPVRIDAGVDGGCLDLRRSLTLAIAPGRLPRGQRVPVAVEDPALVDGPGQAADIARPRDAARGIAGPDRAAGVLQSDQAADSLLP